MTVFPFKNKGQSEFSFNKTVIAFARCRDI